VEALAVPLVVKLPDPRPLAGTRVMRVMAVEFPLAVVMYWLTNKPDFLHQYTRAREIQAETQFDELIDIVDQPPELSYVTGKNGEQIEVKFDSSYVQWMKLRVDTRKWTAARMAPKKYAEYKQPEEKVDAMIIDGEIKTVMDVAIKRLELIRIAE
jgi:hypothetical protein